MTRAYTVVLREVENGFQYAISVTARSSDEAKAQVQADLDEWGEDDEILQVLPVHDLVGSR